MSTYHAGETIPLLGGVPEGLAGHRAHDISETIPLLGGVPEGRGGWWSELELVVTSLATGADLAMRGLDGSNITAFGSLDEFI